MHLDDQIMPDIVTEYSLAYSTAVIHVYDNQLQLKILQLDIPQVLRSGYTSFYYIVDFFWHSALCSSVCVIMHTNSKHVVKALDENWYLEMTSGLIQQVVH